MNPYQHSELAAEIYDTKIELQRRGLLKPMDQADEGNLAVSIAIGLNGKFGIELGEPPDRLP